MPRVASPGKLPLASSESGRTPSVSMTRSTRSETRRSSSESSPPRISTRARSPALDASAVDAWLVGTWPLGAVTPVMRLARTRTNLVSTGAGEVAPSGGSWLADAQVRGNDEVHHGALCGEVPGGLLDLPRRNHEAVADVADGSDDLLVLDAELRPEPTYVDVNRAGAAEVVVAPHLLEQLGAGEDPAGVLRQELEQLELLEREVEHPRANPGGVGGLVDADGAGADLGRDVAVRGTGGQAPLRQSKARLDLSGAGRVEQHVVDPPLRGDGCEAALRDDEEQRAVHTGGADQAAQAAHVRQVTASVHEHGVHRRSVDQSRRLRGGDLDLVQEQAQGRQHLCGGLEGIGEEEQPRHDRPLFSSPGAGSRPVGTGPSNTKGPGGDSARVPLTGRIAHVLPGLLGSVVDRPRVSVAAGAVPVQAWLVADDGVRLSAAYWPPLQADSETDIGTVFVLAHGFTGSWETEKLLRAAAWFRERGAVVALSFRGHGRSGGRSTVGDLEVSDLKAAIRWAHLLGYAHVVPIGFSMGGGIVLRHAGLVGGVDAAVAVSAPSRWYYRGTPPMRLVQWAIGERAGRAAVRLTRGTRVSGAAWNPAPLEPRAAAALGEVPLLIVHGDADTYFPLDHPRQIATGAGERAELWIEPGFGDGESGLTEALAGRIAAWCLAQNGGGRWPSSATGRPRGRRPGCRRRS